MKTILMYISPLSLPFRKELAGIIIALLLFLLFPYMIRKVDVTAASIDAGILSAIILAISSVFLFKAATWWLIKTIWPVFSEYSSLHFERNFKSLFSWQKVLIYLSFYMLIFFGFVAALAALI